MRKRELWRTVKRFLWYLVLSQGLGILGAVIYFMVMHPSQMNNEAAIDRFFESDVMVWAMIAGYIASIAWFLGRGHIRLTMGRLRHSNLWATVGMSEVIAIAWLFTELSLLSLQAYFEMIGKERVLEERLDVGVISPYRAQVQYLRQLVRKREFFKPFRHLISINTVDGFQGQERDIIIISLVRSNDEGQIGFLRDLRRMNVAITRARMKLIILGDRHTMTKHQFYRKLWDYIAELR